MIIRSITQFKCLFLSLCCVMQTVSTETCESKPLFNGENLDGWVIQSNGDFSVEAGMLRVNRGVGWLRSAETFSDFTLALEFRFLEEKANSGIFVRTAETCREDETGYPNNGYQVQCMDSLDGNTPLASVINYGGPISTGNTDKEALSMAYHPQGEWNRMEITCKGDELQVVLNGNPVTYSKGVLNAPGYIGIQAENGLLEFRCIEIVTF